MGWCARGVLGSAPAVGAVQPPKIRKGSAKSAAFPKLRTRARKNCEHALVELGGIETQKLVQDVRLDRWRPWIQRCVSVGYARVRVVLCVLCNEVCNA